MANTIGNEKKQLGDSAPADAAYCETNQKPGRFSDRKHDGNVGTPSKAGRTTDVAKAVHGSFAEPGKPNDDGRQARAGNQPHTPQPDSKYPQRNPVKK